MSTEIELRSSSQTTHLISIIRRIHHELPRINVFRLGLLAGAVADSNQPVVVKTSDDEGNTSLWPRHPERLREPAPNEIARCWQWGVALYSILLLFLYHLK